MLEMEWPPELHKKDPTDQHSSTNSYLPESQSRVEPPHEPEPEDKSETTRTRSGDEIDAEHDSDDHVEFARYEGRNLLAEYWGRTREITEEALGSLARKYVPGDRTCNDDGYCHLISRQHGVYNSVYTVQFRSGQRVCIRVPACGWSERWNHWDQELLRCTALAMRMIEIKTDVPLPRVIAYDCSFDNDIQAPFMLMTCIDGTGARQVWNSDEGAVPKEVRRQNILKGMAQAMSGLRNLKYSKSGSFWFDEDAFDEPVIGESWNLRIEGYIIKRRFEISETYSSTREKVNANLHCLLDDAGFPDHCQDVCTKGMFELYRLIAAAFLDATETPNSDEDFVLMHGDFDIQNMLVDDAGNLAGILDWDGLSSQPRQAGWSMVPFWLQGDWASGYRWPPAIGADYASVRPDEFERYRQDYARYMWEACGGVGDCRFTSKSHIYRAFLNSTTDRFEARRFVENVIAEILPRARGLAYCTQLGENGFRSGEKEWLNTRLHSFFKPEPPLAAMPDEGTCKLPKMSAGLASGERRRPHDIVQLIKNILQMLVLLLKSLVEMLSGGLLPISESHVRGGTGRR